MTGRALYKCTAPLANGKARREWLERMHPTMCNNRLVQSVSSIGTKISPHPPNKNRVLLTVSSVLIFFLYYYLSYPTSGYGKLVQWRRPRSLVNLLSLLQVALQWAAVLGGAPAARLLSARGLAALGARWALQAQRYLKSYKDGPV